MATLEEELGKVNSTSEPAANAKAAASQTSLHLDLTNKEPEEAVPALIEYAANLHISDLFFNTDEDRVEVAARHLGLLRHIAELRPELGRRCISYIKTLAGFMAAAPRVDAGLRRGETIAQSLTDCRVFTSDFLGILAVAEESGRLPEVLRHQAEEYDDEARRRLSTVNKLASYGVWVLVAALLITAIFRIFTIAYLENIQKHLGR